MSTTAFKKMVATLWVKGVVIVSEKGDIMSGDTMLCSVRSLVIFLMDCQFSQTNSEKFKSLFVASLRSFSVTLAGSSHLQVLNMSCHNQTYTYSFQRNILILQLTFVYQFLYFIRNFLKKKYPPHQACRVNLFFADTQLEH